MATRLRCFAALIVGLGSGVLMLLTPSAVRAATMPEPPRTVDSWAWCGVNPDDPSAATAIRTMVQAAGIDATFGPCLPYNHATYTPAEPNTRYATPDVYMRLVQLNASFGIKTIVYDARLWNTNVAIRGNAMAFWAPVLANIAAWDMGDEFDPTKQEWTTLKDRWTIMRNVVEPTTGVKPFTNFFPSALNKALTDLPGIERLLSFDQYQGDQGVQVAQDFDSRARLMCAVNEIDHNGLGSTAATVRTAMDALQAAGCDQFLVFTGFPVYDSGGAFANDSVVDFQGAATNRAPATQEGSGHSSLIPIGPIRVLETRSGPGLSTFDGGFNGIGIRPDDSTLELGISGRSQLPGWARSVLLNVTVTGALGDGYLTVYPCGEPRPTSSNLNYGIGTTKAAAVVASIGDNGAVCVYTQTSTHVVVDVTGFYPRGSSFTGVQPGRLIDTRIGPEFPTVDGQFAAVGRRAAGSITAVTVTGRGTVPQDARAVAVNVTAINPLQEGFLTVFPCGGTLPLASTLNFTPGSIVPNAAVVQVGAGGAICVFSNVDVDLVIDVNGYDGAKSVARSFEPLRVLETRPGQITADRQFETQALRPADSVLELQIGGRLGVPTTIRAAVLNVTVTEATGPGFLTVYPCNGGRPVASTLNYGRGTTVANLAVASTTADGKVCIYTQTTSHLVVDLSGYHT